MRIIEFMGCPGSGKSSVCKGIMDELTREGYNVANVHRDEIRKGGLSRKILSARSRLSPKMRSLGAELDKVMAYLPDKDSVWKRDVLNSSYKIGQKYVQELDYAFFEEGPTQYITSILHDNAAGGYLRPLIDEVNRIFYAHDVTAFYITADPEEIVDRIRKRNRSGISNAEEADTNRPSRALVSIASSTSRTWSAMAPEARADLFSPIAETISATPMPRRFSL